MGAFILLVLTSAFAQESEICEPCVGGWEAKSIILDEEDISIINGSGYYVEIDGNMASVDWSLEDPEYDAVTNPDTFRMSKGFSSSGGPHTVSCGLVDEFGMRGELACWGPETDDFNAPPAGTYTMMDSYGYGHCAISAVDGSIVTWGSSSNHAGVGTEPSGTGFTDCAVAIGGIMCATGQPDGGVVCWGNTSHIDTTGDAALPTTGTYVDVELDWTKFGGAVKDDGTLEFFGDSSYHIYQNAVARAPAPVAGVSDLVMDKWSTYVALDSLGYAHTWSAHGNSDSVVLSAPISYDDAYAQMHGPANDKWNATSPLPFTEIVMSNWNVCGIVAEVPTEPVVSLSHYQHPTTDYVHDIEVGGVMCWGKHTQYGGQQATMFTEPCQ